MDKDKNTEGLVFEEKKDAEGQLSFGDWSCIMLDWFQEGLPLLGPKGREVLFRVTQEIERINTYGTGDLEGDSTKLGDYYLVNVSYDHYIEFCDLLGIKGKPKEKPREVNWVFWDFEPHFYDVAGYTYVVDMFVLLTIEGIDIAYKKKEYIDSYYTLDPLAWDAYKVFLDEMWWEDAKVYYKWLLAGGVPPGFTTEWIPPPQE